MMQRLIRNSLSAMRVSQGATTMMTLTMSLQRRSAGVLHPGEGGSAAPPEAAGEMKASNVSSTDGAAATDADPGLKSEQPSDPKEKSATTASRGDSRDTSSSSSSSSLEQSRKDASSMSAKPGDPTSSGEKQVQETEGEPRRWLEAVRYEDPDQLPIVDENGEYIVSRVQWPTGELAYQTPAPVDDKLAPRFGYNVVTVKKTVTWWQYNQKYPRLSFAYLNIQLLFLLGLAWLVAFLTTEYRRTTEAMRTPGAMVGEHRGRGPATNKTQKISFTNDEMANMVNRAQNNWYDGKAEADYIGSKEYKMKSIPRPKEFSAEDFKKR